MVSIFRGRIPRETACEAPSPPGCVLYVMDRVVEPSALYVHAVANLDEVYGGIGWAMDGLLVRAGGSIVGSVVEAGVVAADAPRVFEVSITTILRPVMVSPEALAAAGRGVGTEEGVIAGIARAEGQRGRRVWRARLPGS